MEALEQHCVMGFLQKWKCPAPWEKAETSQRSHNMALGGAEQSTVARLNMSATDNQQNW